MPVPPILAWTMHRPGVVAPAGYGSNARPAARFLARACPDSHKRYYGISSNNPGMTRFFAGFSAKKASKIARQRLDLAEKSAAETARQNREKSRRSGRRAVGQFDG